MKNVISEKVKKEKLLRKFVTGKKNTATNCRSCRACFGGPPRPKPR